MSVEILYRGIVAATGIEPSGDFFAMDAPLPVGTLVTLRGPDGEQAMRVVSVREGEGAGMQLKKAPVEAAPVEPTPPPDLPRPPPRAERRKKRR